MSKIAQHTNTVTLGYAGKGRLPLLKAPSTLQLAVFFARAFYENSAGSPPTADVGVVRLLSKNNIQVFNYSSGTTYTSLAVPNGSASTVISNATNGNGFVVQAKRQFGMVGLNISQTDAATITASYWNGASWSALTVIAALSASSAAETRLIFLPPLDWAQGGDGILQSNLYAVRIVTATKPTANIQANDLWVGSWIEFYRNLAAGQGVAVRFQDDYPLLLEADEGIMPYFATSTTDNGMTIAWATV